MVHIFVIFKWQSYFNLNVDSVVNKCMPGSANILT